MKEKARRKKCHLTFAIVGSSEGLEETSKVVVLDGMFLREC